MPRPPDPGRRARTLAGAADYVLEHGLSGLSLRPLAAALDTSTRMLLYDFGGKERLVAEVLAEIRRREAALLADHVPDGTPPEALLRDIWGWLSAPERAPFLRLFFEVYADTLAHPDAYPPEVQGMVTDWLDRFAGELGDPVAATLALAVVRGLLLDRLATGDAARTDEALARFAELLDR